MQNLQADIYCCINILQFHHILFAQQGFISNTGGIQPNLTNVLTFLRVNNSGDLDSSGNPALERMGFLPALKKTNK